MLQKFKHLKHEHKKRNIIKSIVILLLLLSFVRIDGQLVFRWTNNIRLSKVTDEDIGKLKTMPFVSELEIRNFQTNDISFIKNMPFLTKLKIWVNNGSWSYVEDWSPISYCKNLKVFNAAGCTIDDFTYFSGLDRLEELDANFYFSMDIIGLDGIENIVSLKRLYLSGLECTSADEINSLKNLEELHISGSNIVELNIELENLKELWLTWDHDLNDCNISDKCNKLEKLYIVDLPVGAVDVEQLLELPSLNNVIIKEGFFTEDECAKLEENGVTIGEYDQLDFWPFHKSNRWGY